MKTAILNSRFVMMAGAAAAVALAAMGFAGSVQARDNVSFSVGIGVPGVQFGVNNVYPVYSQQPVYVQPQPVYVQRQVYVQPQPYFVHQAPVYVQPQSVFVRDALGYGGYQPVYYDRPSRGYYRPGRGHENGHENGHGNGHGYGHGQGQGHQGGYQSHR